MAKTKKAKKKANPIYKRKSPVRTKEELDSQVRPKATWNIYELYDALRLQVGDQVLNRTRKAKYPEHNYGEPKEQDIVYRIAALRIDGGNSEQDMTPCKVVASVEYFDGSIGERVWNLHAPGSPTIWVMRWNPPLPG